MTPIVLTWIVLVLLEASRNWYLIVKRKKTPIHKKAWALRVSVGVVFWIATPIIYHELPYDSWWAMPVMMAFTFWWVFDSSLNLMRGLPIWYLDVKEDPDEDSSIDAFQLRTFGAWPWFWFKFFLAGASITTFYYGWNGVLGIS